jgi:adenylate cyclase
MPDAPDRPSRTRRTARRISRVDGHPRLVALARMLRRRLPGDPAYGDPLSLAGEEPAHLIGKQLAAVSAARPSALRELGFGALQAFQALSEAQGRGHGDREVAILFTDLAGFSDWTLEAGDTMALELLRRVGLAVDPVVTAHGGRVVKRLGDGLMAVFDDAGSAVAAAEGAVRAAAGVRVGDYGPRLRAGVHVGTPRKLGGDFYGADVNIAARVAAAAEPDEVLVSDAVRERLSGHDFRRRWFFSAKGAPKDLRVYSLKGAE